GRSRPPGGRRPGLRWHPGPAGALPAGARRRCPCVADDTKVSARAWTAFVAVSVLWGVPYFFIKLAVGEVSPAFLAWARIGLRALVLIPIAWRMGAFRGVRDRAAAVVAYAASEIAVPYVLIPIGEQRIASSEAAFMIAAMPLVVTLLSVWLLPMQRASVTRLIGLAT